MLTDTSALAVRHLADADLQLARTAAERLMTKIRGVGAVFVTGSIVAGLGNETSDLDVVAVLEPGATMEPVVSARVPVDGSVIVDAEITRWEDLLALLKLYNPGDLTAASVNGAAAAAFRRQRDLGRFLIGHDLVDELGLDELRGAFDHSAAQSVLTHANTIDAAGFLTDCLGATRAGDWATALMTSQQALFGACRASLAANRDYYASEKFLLRRVFNVPHLVPVAGAVWNLLFAAVPLDSPQEVALELVLHRTFLATSLLSQQELGLVPDIDAAKRWDLEGGGPLRSPFLTVLVTDDEVALQGPEGVRLSADAARLWLLLDGGPLPSVVDRFAAVAGVTRIGAERYVKANLRALEEHHALLPSDLRSRLMATRSEPAPCQ